MYYLKFLADFVGSALDSLLSKMKHTTGVRLPKIIVTVRLYLDFD